MNRSRLLLPVLLIGYSALPVLAQKTRPAKSPPAARVAGVRVPRGTPEQVRAHLAKRLAPKLARRIALSDGSRTVARTRRELGVRLDLDRMARGVTGGQRNVPLVLAVDRSAAKAALTRLARVFHAPAVEARPVAYRGSVTIRPSRYARTLNVSTTAERLAGAVARNPGVSSIRVALNKKAPVLTTERLKGVNGVLATFATRAGGGAKRLHNMRLAASAIDGTLLSPGEVFSLNETVGERTQARGYLTAPVFVKAEIVDGIGGGVSQITGTLFNAAALAGLAIREVHPHSRPVGYLPLGRDATVAWQAKDLKFANNTSAPVFIEYRLQGGQLRARFYGRRATNRRVALRPAVKRRGPGNIYAQLYRIVRINGKVVAKERLLTHGYRWDPKT